jgi:hypothetical protein
MNDKKNDVSSTFTTNFGFYDWPLQLHTSRDGHMQLVTSELLNPCCFTHLIAKDVQLQG